MGQALKAYLREIVVELVLIFALLLVSFFVNHWLPFWFCIGGATLILILLVDRMQSWGNHTKRWRIK